MSGSRLAIIEALWIAEVRPDLFSALIMRFLRAPYSHNALLYKGKIWHATTPGGVCEELPEEVLKGCRIYARKRIQLNVIEEYFEGWLEGERGKGYGHIQNVGLVLGTIFPFMKRWLADGQRRRNCSEFIGTVCHKFSGYKLQGGCDYWKPTDTFKVLNPDIEP